MKTSEQINHIATALSKAQSTIKKAKKDSENPFFKSSYADLVSVVEAARPALVENGLAVVQGGLYVDGQWMLVSRLTHVSGQWFETYFPLISKDQTAQSMGSAMSYAKRYSYQALLNVVSDGEDDDAEATMGRSSNPNYTVTTTLSKSVPSAPVNTSGFTFGFGKYKGKSLSEVPAHELLGYAAFLEKSEKKSPNTIATIEAIKSWLTPPSVTMEQPSDIVANDDLPF